MHHPGQVRFRPQPSLETSCLEVYEAELTYLLETLQRLGACPRELEDLAQEVFVVLHRKWPTLDATRPFRPYLSAVAFRVVCAHRRRVARDVPAGVQLELEHEDRWRSPEASLQSKESVRLLMAALDRVPSPRRAVIVMHDLDGLSIADVAARLSITEFGVYSRLRKARREVASALRRFEGGVSR